MTKLEKIIAVLENVGHNGQSYGYIELTIPGQDGTEFIVNSHASMPNKIEYYKKTYDADGVHKFCKDIRIVSAGTMEQFYVVPDVKICV